MSDGEPGQVNAHVSWRMAVAGRAAGAYAPNRRLAVLAVAGRSAAAWPTDSPTWSWTATGMSLRKIVIVSLRSKCSAVRSKLSGSMTRTRRNGARTISSAHCT